MRANEEGIRWIVQNVAALAAVTFSPSDPDAVARSAALNARIGTKLGVPPGTQKIEDIQAELAGAQPTLQSAADRHRQTKSTLAGMHGEIEGVSTEEVAAQILALQTQAAGLAADDVAALPDESRWQTMSWELKLRPAPAIGPAAVRLLLHDELIHARKCMWMLLLEFVPMIEVGAGGIVRELLAISATHGYRARSR